MKQKLLNIFIPLFLVIILGIVIFQKFQQSDLLAEFKMANENEVSGVIFFKDFLRDSEELNLAIEKMEVAGFVDCLRNMEPSNLSIKSLQIERDVKIHFLFKQTDVIELHIMQAEEYEDFYIISANWIQGDLSINAGQYTSKEFIDWFKKIDLIPVYKNIWEY